MPDKIRNACIVINNWEDDDITKLTSLSFRYLVYGKEGKPCKDCARCHKCKVCSDCKSLLTSLYKEHFEKFEKIKDFRFDIIREIPECSKCITEHCDKCEEKCIYKTQHLQVYVEFNNPVSYLGVRKQLPGAFIEPVRAASKLIEYCKKEGDFTVLGSAKSQGLRSDISEHNALALTGGMRAVTTTGSLTQIRTAEEFLKYNEAPRDWFPNVIWIYGPTETNKSRLARKILRSITSDVLDQETHGDTFTVHPILSDDSSEPYCKNDKSKWWTGYDGHPNVIFDDFRDSWWPMADMLALLDRYECRVEMKGSVRQFKARNIVITSIRSPFECYKGMKYTEPLGQLIRRLSEIINLEYYHDENDKYDKHKSYFKSYSRTEDMSPSDPTIDRFGILDTSLEYPECLNFHKHTDSEITRNEEYSSKRKISANQEDLLSEFTTLPAKLDRIKDEISTSTKDELKKNPHFETFIGRQRTRILSYQTRRSKFYLFYLSVNIPRINSIRIQTSINYILKKMSLITRTSETTII